VLNIDPVDDTFNRSKLNLSYRMPFPDADKLGLIQNWRYGGVPNGPTSNFSGTPFRNFNHTYDITDNVAKIWGAHQFMDLSPNLRQPVKSQNSSNGELTHGTDPKEVHEGVQAGRGAAA
jgi:hypothetical protein